ncbi:MAG: serine/threonine protein kinase [Myxococcales bacterium]|nr:serine/threonine protein kinase [Myxococcales bacterium]
MSSASNERAAPPARDLAGSCIGPYLCERRIGVGGMAEVWLARRRGPAGFSRACVLKLIRRDRADDPGFVSMFLAEARLSARLHHANIVQVFELGEDGGEHYLAMELVDGKSLHEISVALASAGEPAPVGFALWVGRALCAALEHAHDAVDDSGTPLKILHRDVTPSNVLVSRDGVVKLADFGVAKALADPLAPPTQAGRVKGKESYAAPEQLRGDALDRRADLYAVGVIMHELVTGRRLFERGAARGDVAPPSRVRADVPPAVDEICRRALAPRRDERYADAGAMRRDVEAALAELRFGEREAAALVAALAPLAATDDDTRTTDRPHARAAVTRADRPTRRARRPRLLAALFAAALIAIAAWLVVRTSPSSSPSPVHAARSATPARSGGELATPPPSSATAAPDAAARAPARVVKSAHRAPAHAGKVRRGDSVVDPFAR